MKKYSYSGNHLSKNVRLQLLSYYQELYNNLEMKSVIEMSEELGFSERTIYYFIDQYCNIDVSDNNYSASTIWIMTCTKFYITNKLYLLQKEKFGEVIKKRNVLKQVKLRNEKLKEKRNKQK